MDIAVNPIAYISCQCMLSASAVSFICGLKKPLGVIRPAPADLVIDCHRIDLHQLGLVTMLRHSLATLREYCRVVLEVRAATASLVPILIQCHKLLHEGIEHTLELIIA